MRSIISFVSLLTAFTLLILIPVRAAHSSTPSCVSNDITLNELTPSYEPGSAFVNKPLHIHDDPLNLNLTSPSHLNYLKLNLEDRNNSLGIWKGNLKLDLRVYKGTSYSSPYLWEAGHSPGIKATPFTFGPSYMPVPVPVPNRR